MVRKNLDTELKRINSSYKKQASFTMGEMNSRGILYSSFTIRERVKNTTDFCNKEFLELIANFNSKKDQKLINTQIDGIIKSEKDSLKTFCNSMKNVKCTENDFIPLREMRGYINNKIIIERRKRIIEIATLVVATLTLLFSAASVVQWFIPRTNATIESESENE